MKHKGYEAIIGIDEESGTLHGRVANTRDVITFEGRTVKELERAFRDSVDDYLAMCTERGEKPEKPFSGTMIVRMPPALHAKLAIEAAKSGESLNAWVTEHLSRVTTQQTKPRAVKRRGAKKSRSRAPRV